MAKTGVPFTAMAAAAWSWVEKMLHEAQRTSAPSACRVSMRTAVWMVMCSEPLMRAPRRGCWLAYSSRIAMRPGISVSAIRISLRPQSARLRSVTACCWEWVDLAVALISRPPLENGVCERRCYCRPGGRPLRAWRESPPSQRSSEQGRDRLYTGRDEGPVAEMRQDSVECLRRVVRLVFEPRITAEQRKIPHVLRDDGRADLASRQRNQRVVPERRDLVPRSWLLPPDVGEQVSCAVPGGS